MQGATTRRSINYVEEEQRRRRPKGGLPRKGWPILGCDCVTRRRHSQNYASSSFLVSLQNRLSQYAHNLMKGPLSLSLFVFGVRADHPHHPFAADDLAIVANLLNTRANFHLIFSINVVARRAALKQSDLRTDCFVGLSDLLAMTSHFTL